jgi:hypothetical protein
MTNTDLPDLDADAVARIEEARNRGRRLVLEARAEGNQLLRFASEAAIGSDSEQPHWARGQADGLVRGAQTRAMLLCFDVMAYEHFSIAAAMPQFNVVLVNRSNEAEREFHGEPHSLEVRKQWWSSRAQGRATLQSVTFPQLSRTFWSDLEAQFRGLESPHVCAVVRDGWWRIEGLPHEPYQERTMFDRFCSTTCRAVSGLGFTEHQVDISVNVWLDALVAKESPHCAGRSINNLCIASAEYCEEIIAGFERQAQPSQAPSNPPSGVADKQTRRRRREILDRYCSGNQLETRPNLARHLGMSLTALQGIMRGDVTRYSEDKLSKFLKKIGVAPEDW